MEPIGQRSRVEQQWVAQPAPHTPPGAHRAGRGCASSAPHLPRARQPVRQGRLRRGRPAAWAVVEEGSRRACNRSLDLGRCRPPAALFGIGEELERSHPGSKGACRRSGRTRVRRSHLGLALPGQPAYPERSAVLGPARPRTPPVRRSPPSGASASRHEAASGYPIEPLFMNQDNAAQPTRTEPRRAGMVAERRSRPCRAQVSDETTQMRHRPSVELSNYYFSTKQFSIKAAFL